MGLAAVMAFWSIIIALRFRTQQAAPLMQVANFIAVAVHDGLRAARRCSRAGCRTISDVNPVTQVLEGVRQGFIGAVTWHDTWPALLAVVGLIAGASARSPCAACAATASSAPST